jgi:hypothetical protein
MTDRSLTYISRTQFAPERITVYAFMFGVILTALGLHLRRRTTALSRSATTLIDGR